MRRLLRFLKLADNLDKSNDALGLQRLCAQFDAFVKKHYAKAKLKVGDIVKAQEGYAFGLSQESVIGVILKEKVKAGRTMYLVDPLDIEKDEKKMGQSTWVPEYVLEQSSIEDLDKKAHYAPKNDGNTPNLWRRNMDYAGWENSPYFGSVAEFMEKFPGGIRDWIEWRRDTQEDRNKKWSDFSREKKVAQRIKMAGKKRKAIYSAVFLSPESKKALADWWSTNQGELLPKQFMHHMTLKFKPSPEDVLSLPLGKDVQLQIVGVGYDAKGQAVAVSSDLPVDNPIPHITVATDGTSPVYSNELLSAGIAPIDIESAPAPLLTGTVGFFDGKGMRVDFTGTVYEGMDQTEPATEPESDADEIDYFGEEVTDEEHEKAFDLIAENIEKYKEMFGLTDEEIKQWLESKFGKMSEAHFVDVKKDRTEDFPNEPHLWSGEGPASFKSILDYVKKYRSQDANDAASKAVIDFIKYWKLLKKVRKNKGANK